MIEPGLIADQSNSARIVGTADEADTFARSAEANLHFGADRNEVDETAERLRQEIAAFMTAVEAHLFAEQARRDADSDRRIAGV